MLRRRGQLPTERRCFIIDLRARPALYTMIARASQTPRPPRPPDCSEQRRTRPFFAVRRMPRPLLAQINLSALRANLARAREKAAGAQVLAVVKANAYGHGLARVLPALEDADGLALLELDAALMLRERHYSRRILLIEGFFEPRELAEVAQRRLAVVVHDAEQVGV